MTGHTELHGQNLKIFTLRNFGESIIYQRPEKIRSPLNATESLTGNLSSGKGLSESFTVSEVGQNSQNPMIASPLNSLELQLLNLKKLLGSEKYLEVLETTYKLLQNHSNCFELFVLAAEAHANLGEYQKAKASCWRALELQEFATSPTIS